MLTPDEAEKAILDHMAPFLREDCPLEAAHGRVLRADVRADRDLPPFDRVTMDGYAVRTAVIAAGTRTFRIEGTQAAGMRALKLSPVEHACVEVMTGAVLPEGADAVVPFEQTTRDGDVVTLAAGVAPPAGFSIHRRRSDHAAGEVVVPAGRRISGREIAVAASVGASTLTVSAQPKIAVVVTGDELVEVDDAVGPHQIRRSNDHAVRAALIAAGFPRVERFHLRDLPSEIEHRLWHILAEYDAVLLTGGVSKGKFDFMPAALAAQGVREVFHGVAQRPGKPFWFGVTSHHKPVFALPGNPVSAYTCLHRYVLPALAHASGIVAPAPRLVALATPVNFAPPLAYLLPVRLGSGPHAELLATPDPSNTSGDFAGLIGTDGFVELPADRTAFPIGTVARYFAWV
ncbi:molybdopterin molybdotransferase MoeA [Horticoccus luteus]|uniref:Molybdopterin molybdenumtransferase n=1 Tax=Horticoccus luteus TaxID=2862869 RepID=A0A8F9TWI1_9BACT|nr:molybdopterin molybdotransferase MoeA [Horticoccus luteus]QYM79099.1 molybdopterin molybdotransferase MoeA [Horticoccus luteus]